jgi:uncharacterized protein YbaP (TraB family)
MQARISPMIRGVLRCLIGFFVALLLPASAALAEPAMWVVKDEDSTVYLFGTFHLVKPETQWWSEKIDAAFRDSNELWLEASEQGNPALLQGLVLKHGMDLARPLSSKLGPEDWARVQSAGKLAGLPESALNVMRPWMAALTLAVAPIIKQGYDPTKGADMHLEAAAKTSNKVVKTFETPEQQLLFFASMPEQSEIAFLLQTLDEVAHSATYVDRMSEAWVAGDTKELEAMALAKMRAEAPELYETLFVQRNMEWSEQIAAMMRGSGTSFIAVGAGHLVGERSVQAILAERGFEVAPY